MTIRPELKELKDLTDGNHVIHSSEENKQFRKDLFDYVDIKGGKDDSFRITSSGSFEGGIAMSWWGILKDPNFGEMLHLRFHEGRWSNKYLERGWYMTFHLNTYQGRNPFSKLGTKDIEKVISACKELIKCAEDVLTYTRTEGKQ